MPTTRLLPLVLAALAACAPTAPTAPAPAPVPLAEALETVFDDTAFTRAHWGVEVRSLRTGELLYARNPEKLFLPASNMKVVTGAAALEALGPEYRYRTTVAATGPVEGGVLRGSLVVRGSGDPTLSARFGDPHAAFRAWADSLRARGVTRVTGSLVGDDDVFDDVPLGRGWAWDDLEAGYAAEFGGLFFNEGVVRVRVAPGEEPGALGRVSLLPATEHVAVDNRTVTTAPGVPAAMDVDRLPTGSGIVVTGNVPLDTAEVTATIAVRDNTLFFLHALRGALAEAGIRVEGPVVDADLLPGGAGALEAAPLFVHASPPMREVLPAFLKPSQNQIGEVLLKTLGRELRAEGSGRAGAAAVDSLLLVWGLDPALLRMADGSGLSRYNLVAPELLIGILRHMERSPHREVWHASLPLAGVDGTLARRLKETPLEGRVRAKTGTLSGVRALSGYLPGAGGEPLVFSILLNHHTRSAADADRVIDAALLLLAGAGS